MVNPAICHICDKFQFLVLKTCLNICFPYSLLHSPALLLLTAINVFALLSLINTFIDVKRFGYISTFLILSVNTPNFHLYCFATRTLEMDRILRTIHIFVFYFKGICVAFILYHTLNLLCIHMHYLICMVGLHIIRLFLYPGIFVPHARLRRWQMRKTMPMRRRPSSSLSLPTKLISLSS